MGKLITVIRKTTYWLKHDLFIFDNVIILVAGVFCLIWTWGSIAAMSRNWELSQQLTERRRQKALLELEVETLELENEYYRSPEYQELAARKYQKRKLAGEVMVYLPKNSEIAKNKHKTNPAEEEPVVAEVNEMTNFQQWVGFLFGI